MFKKEHRTHKNRYTQSMLLIAICVFSCVSLSCGSSKAYDGVFLVNGVPSKLRILEVHAPYTYYAFPTEVNTLRMSNSESNQSLSVTLAVNPEFSESHYSFFVGLLYASDFIDPEAQNLRLKKEIPSRALAKSSSVSGSISVSLEIPSSASIKGFVVYIDPDDDTENTVQSHTKKEFVKLTHVKIESTRLGWDISAAVPWFGFSSDGGIAGISASLAVPKGYNVDMTVAASDGSQTRINASLSESNVPQGVFTIRTTPHMRTARFDSAFFTHSIQTMAVTQGLSYVRSFVASVAKQNKTVSSSDLIPIKADPGLIVDWNIKSWRQKDFELFAWDSFPSVLIIDTANYRIQNSFFKRLAFFVEKAGYSGTLWHDSDIANLHAYNAHDYSAESLASFFNRAEKESFPLNEYELFLKEILFAQGLIRRSEQSKNGYDINDIIAGEGAVMSFSQESPEYLRYTFIPHELFHTLFFIDEEFRLKVAAVYEALPTNARQFLLAYFTEMESLGYNVEDTYLMHNEFMAYLLQQQLNRVGDYFLNTLASRLAYRNAVPQLVSHVRGNRAADFVRAAEELSVYVEQRWNYAAGRVSLIAYNPVNSAR